jgi:hypothetical protein
MCACIVRMNVKNNVNVKGSGIIPPNLYKQKLVVPYLCLMTTFFVLSPYFWVCTGPALVLRPAERDRPLLSHHLHLHLPLLQAPEIISHHVSEFFPPISRIRIKEFKYCMDPIDLIFYRERSSQPAKNETKEK